MSEIYKRLEMEIDKALENLPTGLPVRNRRRYVNRALDEIAKSVGREYGIANPSSQGLKNVFWNCHCTFPNFDDEAYIQTLKGEPFTTPVQICKYKYLDTYHRSGRRDFSNEVLVNDKWGANYDPESKEMLGGYSEDGKQFRPDFRIKELEEDDIPNALAVCSLLYSKHGKIDTTYTELQKLLGEAIENQEVTL